MKFNRIHLIIQIQFPSKCPAYHFGKFLFEKLL